MTLTHPLYQAIPDTELWRLCVDGTQQQNDKEIGFLGFSMREPGSIRQYICAYQYMLENIKAPLTPTFIKNLHGIAMKDLTVQGDITQQDAHPGQFRNKAVRFGLTLGKNLTINGYNELLAIRDNSNMAYQLTNIRHGLTPVEGDRKFDLKIESTLTRADLIESCVQMEIDQYKNETENAKSKEEIERSIVRLIQQLERIHPFSDGNCRVLCSLLLNKLRLENELPPVIVHNPNYFDGYTIEELMKEVAAGKEAFERLTSGDVPYEGSMTTKRMVETIKGMNSKKVCVCLMLMVCESQTQIINTFFENNDQFDINQPITSFGNNALILAAYMNDIEMVKTILKQKNIDVNATGAWNGTAYYWAHHQGNNEIKQLLLEHGANKMETLPIIEQEENLFEFILKKMREGNLKFPLIFELPSIIVPPLAKKEIADHMANIHERLEDNDDDFFNVLEIFRLVTETKHSPTQFNASPLLSHTILFYDKFVEGIRAHLEAYPCEEIIEQINPTSFDCYNLALYLSTIKSIYPEKIDSIIDAIAEKVKTEKVECLFVVTFLRCAPHKSDVILSAILDPRFKIPQRIIGIEELIKHHPDREAEIKEKTGMRQNLKL